MAKRSIAANRQQARMRNSRLELTNEELQALHWIVQAAIRIDGASDEQMEAFYRGKVSLKRKVERLMPKQESKQNGATDNCE